MYYEDPGYFFGTLFNINLMFLMYLSPLIIGAIIYYVKKNPEKRLKTALKIGKRNPWFAAILSVVIPGVGQAYNYQPLKTVIFVFAFINLIAIFLYYLIEVKNYLLSLVFFILTFGLYVFSIKDAYETAGKINNLIDSRIRKNFTSNGKEKF